MSTIRKRKEAKKMKYINQYAADYTGEGPFHAWFDPKKVKALFTSYQETRNRHRFTCPLEEKDQKVLEQKMKEYEKYYV